MAVSLANWDTRQFASDVILAFSEAGKIPMDSYIRKNTNESLVVFGQTSAVTVANVADGTALADAGGSESAVTIQADNPLKAWVYIPTSVISTHGSVNALSNYATEIGSRLREKLDYRLINLLATSSPTSVPFDDEAATDALMAVEIATALKTVAKNFDIAKTPVDGRFVALHPTYFTTLYQVAGIRSGDFITGADNAKPFQSLNFMGMTVISFVGNFGVDTSADTAYDTKYRINMSVATGNKCWGVAWHRSALGVNYYEMPTVTEDFIPKEDQWLVKGRCLPGTGLLRGAGYRQIIVGD